MQLLQHVYGISVLIPSAFSFMEEYNKGKYIGLSAYMHTNLKQYPSGSIFW